MVTKRKDQDPPADQGQVMVTAGREVYAPVAFHSFEVGPLSVTTDLQAGETFEQAHGRAAAFLEDAFVKQFETKMESFFKRLGRIDEYMVANNMIPRSQSDTFRASSSKPAPREEPQGEPNAAGWVGQGAALGNELAATGAQLSCMEKIAAKAGIDASAICMEIFDCNPAGLKKPAMSKFLDYINDKIRFPELLPFQQAQVAAGTLKTSNGGSELIEPPMPPMREYVDDDIPF